MVLNKSRILMLVSILCFFIMSIDFLIMPASNDFNKNLQWLEVLTTMLFWLPLIAGVLLQIIIAIDYKKKINSYKISNKLWGAISFFKNRIAAIFDIIFLVTFLVLLIITIFTNITSYFVYVLVSLFAFSFSMHCVLNGKHFNALFMNKNNK